MSSSVLNLRESASLAGVSEEVIKQYAKYGLLKNRSENIDDPSFLEEEIKTLFNVGQATHTSSHHSESEGTAQISEEIEVKNASEREARVESPEPVATADSQVLQSLREQIETLREERNWLRTRLEALETRFEREQALVLSESETIRRLLSQTQQRRTFFQRLSLPWFGSE